jgi:lathosterol oxidase
MDKKHDKRATEPTDDAGMPLAYVSFSNHDPNTAGRWASSGLGLTLSFTVLGLVSRGDLLTAMLFLGGGDIDVDARTAAVCIVAGAALNGLLYWWGCDRFERTFYPEFYGGKRRRADAATWKCQPDRWLGAGRRAEERAWGTFNAVWGTVLSLAFYFVAHLRLGWTQLYVDTAMHGGLPYYLLSFVLLLLYIEVWAYWSHRFWHIKALYVHFHKWHHRYQPPTPFSAVAFHPLEFAVYVIGGQAVFYLVPFHVSVVVVVGCYTAYYLVADHSGVKCEPLWPWQPTSRFHDDHHRYFHCNFGQHVLWLDRVFGTLRSVKKKYGEARFVDD